MAGTSLPSCYRLGDSWSIQGTHSVQRTTATIALASIPTFRSTNSSVSVRGIPRFDRVRRKKQARETQRAAAFIFSSQNR
jgi:hypothetical protein